MSKTRDYGWTEQTPGSAGYLNDVIIDLARRAGAATVLDAGCGNGELAARLARAGFDVTGVDGDGGGVEIARAQHPGVRFEVAQFDQPPPGVFDFVCSTEVVEHLYAPHELALYCFQALKPGGLLAISTPYHGYLKNLALSLFDHWDRHHTPLWHGGHIKFWSRATLGELLRGAGFEVTGFAGAGRAPFLWKSMILTARRPAAR